MKQKIKINGVYAEIDDEKPLTKLQQRIIEQQKRKREMESEILWKLDDDGYIKGFTSRFGTYPDFLIWRGWLFGWWIASRCLATRPIGRRVRFNTINECKAWCEAENMKEIEEMEQRRNSGKLLMEGNEI